MIRKVDAGDFTGAQTDLHHLRGEIGRGIGVDRAAVREVIGNPQRVTAQAVTAALLDVAAKQKAGDQKAALSALDTAMAELLSLSTHAIPATVYLNAKAAVQKEVDQRGEAQPTTLHEAARLGYRAGQFKESLAFAQREVQQLQKVRNPVMTGWFLHLAHTVLGLDYAALGDYRAATDELRASLVDAQSFRFETGPTMALAKVLAAKEPAAVRKFLEDSAQLESWPGRAMAARWRSQLENGTEPDFGGQAALF